MPGALWPAAEKYQDWKLPRDDTDTMYNLLMQEAAKQSAWLNNIRETDLGQKVQKFFPADMKLASFPASGHWCLRWLIFWLGRSLMFFSLNLIQNKCPLLVQESCPEVLEGDFLNRFQDEFLECLYYFPGAHSDVWQGFISCLSVSQRS